MSPKRRRTGVFATLTGVCALALGAAAPGAHADAKPFKVHIGALVCQQTEDSTGADEPYLLFNGDRIWGNGSLNDRQSAYVGKIGDSSGTAEIELFDADAGWFDDDDFLGRVTVTEEQIGQGLQIGRFTEDGASYRLYYTVTAA
jgi:hypothetical protein